MWTTMWRNQPRRAEWTADARPAAAAMGPEALAAAAAAARRRADAAAADAAVLEAAARVAALDAADGVTAVAAAVAAAATPRRPLAVGASATAAGNAWNAPPPALGGTAQWRCQHCGSRDMFCHRPGPNGKGTLCNACGIKWRDQQKREDLPTVVTSAADDASTATLTANDVAYGLPGDDGARGLSSNGASRRLVGAPAGVAAGRVGDPPAVPGLQAAALRGGGQRAMGTTGAVWTAPSSLPAATAADAAEQAVGDASQQVAADGSNRVATSLCVATAEAQAAAAEVVAAVDSPIPSGSPACNTAAAVPSGVPPTDAPSDGATLRTSSMCGLMWTDQQLREQLGSTSDGDSPMEMDAAAADARAQEAAKQGGPGVWKCHQCGTSNSFCHRPGPGGKGTLCNSCGIKWRDQQAQEQQQAATSGAEVSEAAAAPASAATQEPWECQRCAVTSTPCKRNGPNGKKTLCNACGLKWKDQLKRDQREAALAAKSAMETDVAVAAAAVQKQVDDSLAAAASQPSVRQAVTGVWECEHCGSGDMFCHRPGPSGKGTLCNACGLKWRDQQMQQQLAAVSNANTVPEAAPAATDVAPAPPGVTAADAFLATPRRKSSEPWECQRCTITSTTCRRSGPGGKSTLCNACGLRWKDQLKREKKTAVLATRSALDTDVAVAAAAVQQQLDEVSAAAAAAQVTPDRGVGEPWQCQHCVTRDSFCHRPGPNGMGTLCNVCGLKWRDDPMRVQLASVSDPEAVMETATTAAAAVAQEMAGSWQCEQCAVHETVCRRAGPSGDASLCNECGLMRRDQLYREQRAVPSTADASQEAAAGTTTATVAADSDPVVLVPMPRERQGKAKASWHCQRCLTSVTPCHRPGPGGKATLCNACGLKWRDQQKRDERAASVAATLAKRAAQRQRAAAASAATPPCDA
ncbi:hypothetical protein MMPV_009975 [Pyropia vietnamensis]